MTLKTLLIGSTLAIASIGTFAQSTPAADARQANQQTRIEAGERSGALTTHEGNKMERQEKVANKVTANAKADGVVTGAEKVKMHRVDKKVSKDIRSQKHDAQTN